MTHYLRIHDDAGVEEIDLLNTIYKIDISSRQITPIRKGRWQETYRMFAGSDPVNTALEIGTSVTDLDSVVLAISEYGESPAFKLPLWLHEKSEGETLGRRRAPLFGATVQPTTEGTVGQLQLNKSFVGLLTLERGDWEDSVSNTLTIYNDIGFAGGTGDANLFGTVAIPNTGTVNGRVDNFTYYAENTKINYFAMGIREAGFGTANFQNCVSFGSGRTLGTSGTGWNLDNFGTDPVGQTNTYTRCKFYPVTATHTHKVLLSEVSESTLDTVNQDYVGNYRVVLRTTQSTMLDAWFKVTFSYGYEDNMIESSPIYTQGSVETRAFDVGKVSLPNYPYKPNEASTTDLADFTFALKVEIIGSPVGLAVFNADSLFLIPDNNVSISDITGLPAGSSEYAMTMWLENHTDGSYYFYPEAGNASANIDFNMVVPANGGIVVYYNENLENAGVLGDSLITLALNYYPRYNTLRI